MLGYLKFFGNTYFLSLITNDQFAATATFRNLAALFFALGLFCSIFLSFTIYFVFCSTFYPIIFLLFAAVNWCICFFKEFVVKANLF